MKGELNSSELTDPQDSVGAMEEVIKKTLPKHK